MDQSDPGHGFSKIIKRMYCTTANTGLDFLFWLHVFPFYSRPCLYPEIIDGFGYTYFQTAVAYGSLGLSEGATFLRSNHVAISVHLF